MKDLEILEIFTEDDVKFNRKMVDRELELKSGQKFPERRGGKMQMKHERIGSLYAEREFSYASDIINEFRRKWGLSE